MDRENYERLDGEAEKKLYGILEELHPEIDFEEECRLIDGGMLDSFDIVELVTELNNAFDISINASHLIPENFNSAEAMTALIKKLKM